MWAEKILVRRWHRLLAQAPKTQAAIDNTKLTVTRQFTTWADQVWEEFGVSYQFRARAGLTRFKLEPYIRQAIA